MKQTLTKTVGLPFDRAINRIEEELENEGFSLINTSANESISKLAKLELHPFGVYFPCIVFLQEIDTCNTRISAADPVQSISAENLQSFATEIRAIIEGAMMML